MFDDVSSVDACKDNLYKPKLCADRAGISVLDFWPLFFRHTGICEILQERKGKAKIWPEMHYKRRAVPGDWASLWYDT